MGRRCHPGAPGGDGFKKKNRLSFMLNFSVKKKKVHLHRLHIWVGVLIIILAMNFGGGGLTALAVLQGLHLAQVSFMVRAFGSAFTLDLRLNQ